MHFDVPIAQLEVYETDQPWFHCNFVPSNNFNEHQSFFKEFQEKYSSGKVKDYNKFFNALKTNNYCIKRKNKKMVEFIMILNETSNKARLRSRETVNT